jgi:hypothetical protein
VAQKFTVEQNERLRDLLQEKSLWQVYVASRKIPFSKINIGLGVAAAALTSLFAWRAASTALLADQLAHFATMAFNLSIAQLGFLLAGFSFFASIGDKEMFCRMADRTHTQSGLSWLKYNFLVFMRVFCEFLFLALLSLGLMVVLAKGLGIRESISTFLNQWPDAKQPITAIVVGLFIGTVVYLLMQLASFIYNIFHVVMTSIRWALQKDYQERNAAAVEQQARGLPESPPEAPPSIPAND